MSLKALQLRNFQCHRECNLAFTPGLNVIVGATDSGKSAIFRGLQWVVAHGAISGLQTWGTDDTSVSITTETTKVTRFKTKKLYGYSLGNAADPEMFLACASQQPESIRQALGLAPICLQAQHDPPFLLALTPGQIAKEINKIIDLESIDACQGLLKKWVMATRTKLEENSERLEETQQKLAESEWVDLVDSYWNDLQDRHARLAVIESRRKSLKETTAELERIDDETSTLAQLQDDLTEARIQLGIVQGSLLRVESRKTALAAILRDLQESARLPSLIALRDALEALNGASQVLAAAGTKYRSLNGIVAGVRETLDDIRGFQRLRKAVEIVGSEQIQMREKAKKCTRLLEILKTAADIGNELRGLEATRQQLERRLGDICPTCGKLRT